MSKRSIIIALIAGASALSLLASGLPTTVDLKVAKTSPADGKGMYTSYCTPCHGVNGKGNGPLSSSLKRTPSDLTTLSKNNGGNYPEVRVIGILAHGSAVSGHDGAGMPHWAITLGNMDQNNKLDTPLRISNLSRYVETLQTR